MLPLRTRACIYARLRDVPRVLSGGGKRRTHTRSEKIIMVTDPISDFIIQLQNASRVRKARVSLPFSKMKESIAKVLEREGYVADVAAKKDGPLTLSLIYKNDRPAINGVKRISKPSRRMYLGTRGIRPVKAGHGLLMLSTPGGIMTGKEAREKRLGGEVLFEIF